MSRMDEAKRRGEQIVVHVGMVSHLLATNVEETLCGKPVGDDDTYTLASSISCGRCAHASGRPVIHPN